MRDQLLAERTRAGHWEGELSSSALATATAVCALTIVGQHDDLVRNGLRWLAEHQNEDGGFGDADNCPSNVSTTTLAWATLAMHGSLATDRTEDWLKKQVGELTAESMAMTISSVYGEDRTFSVPILTHCALAGKFGWEHIPALPFELAVACSACSPDRQKGGGRNRRVRSSPRLPSYRQQGSAEGTGTR